MDRDEFKKHGHALVDWMADYWDRLREFPVRAQVAPHDIYEALPAAPPEDGEAFDSIFKDFEDVLMPGITHWQHPRFLAYFPANVSPPSVLAEMLVSAMGINGMLWETSPAATELEMRMIDWMIAAIHAPKDWTGCIQGSASEATFCAILMARERATDFASNQLGLSGLGRLTLYVSADAHSSITKDACMAGIGEEGVRQVPVDAEGRMHIGALRAMIKSDRESGAYPMMVVGTAGTTSTGAVDPLPEIADVAREEGLFFHVDAAWAGTAMVCPEFRPLFVGVEAADSFVFNPHKWMAMQFDCSVHLVKDQHQLTRTMAILPEYLKTIEDDRVVNYRDWGIPLGRRMRALKIWFTMRTYGLAAIRAKILQHCRWAESLYDSLQDNREVELVTSLNFSLFCFRFRTENAASSNAFNQAVLDAVNQDGFTYITKTLVGDKLVLRFQVGVWDAEAADITAAWKRIADIARQTPVPSATE